MSTVTENDLRELKDLINSKFEQINEKIDSRYQLLDGKLNDMRVEIASIKGNQEGFSKRLDNLDFLARTVIGGVVLALLVGLAKLLYPNLIN